MIIWLFFATYFYWQKKAVKNAKECTLCFVRAYLGWPMETCDLK